MAFSISGKKLYIPLIIAGILTGVWIGYCGLLPRNLAEVTKTDILMNTSVTVKIFVSSKKDGEKLLDEAFEEAKRIETIMEPRKGDGELKHLNYRTRDGWFTVSPELGAVIREAYKYYEMSGGAFDPTIGPVKWLWNFEESGAIPPENELKQALSYVGFSRVVIRGDSLLFPDRETMLDLGGIAKGYTVDKMTEYLIAHGVRSILVNAGGDILTYGKKPGDADWVIGLRHPRLNRTIILSWNPYPSVATSGDYERFFMENGVRYHHILDPTTGYSAHGCISVTVWTDTAMDADLLATTIFVLGPEKGIALAEKLNHVETCIFYERDGTVEHVESSGVKGRIGL